MKASRPLYFNQVLAASVFYLGVAASALAHPPTTAAATLPAGVIATVNGVGIAQSQLDAQARASGQPDNVQVRQALKKELIVRELLRQQAEQAHYDAKPQVQEVMTAAKANAETQLYLQDHVHPDTVTDAQVKARYDELVASLGSEEYRPSIIAVPDAATAAMVLGKLKAGMAFDILAQQYSTAPSKASGGELPWVSFKLPATEGKTQGLPLPIAQALTQLPVGGITPESIPVSNANSTVHVIVKLDSKRPTNVLGFDQAKDRIRQQLQALARQKATTAFAAKLVKGATITQ